MKRALEVSNEAQREAQLQVEQTDARYSSQIAAMSLSHQKERLSSTRSQEFIASQLAEVKKQCARAEQEARDAQAQIKSLASQLESFKYISLAKE